tara:strand:+ start:5868 stop:6488 length:621 start_codon:yes stop_codon:yes gene_type:complete
MAETFDKAKAYAQAVPEMVGTVGEYVSDAIPRSGPFGLPSSNDLVAALARMGIDARNLMGGMAEAAVEDPAMTALEMNPVAGAGLALMDSDNLMSQALQAEEAGDLDKASTLRQLAAVTLIGALPGVPGVTKLARKAKTPKQLADSIKVEESMARAEKTIKNPTAAQAAYTPRDTGEGTRAYVQQSPKDVDLRRKMIEQENKNRNR